MKKVLLLAAVLMTSCIFAGENRSESDNQQVIVNNDKVESQLWNDEIEQPGSFAMFDNNDKIERAISHNGNDNDHDQDGTIFADNNNGKDNDGNGNVIFANDSNNNDDDNGHGVLCNNDDNDNDNDKGNYLAANNDDKDNNNV